MPGNPERQFLDTTMTGSIGAYPFSGKHREGLIQQKRKLNREGGALWDYWLMISGILTPLFKYVRYIIFIIRAIDPNSLVYLLLQRFLRHQSPANSLRQLLVAVEVEEEEEDLYLHRRQRQQPSLVGRIRAPILKDASVVASTRVGETASLSVMVGNLTGHLSL